MDIHEYQAKELLAGFGVAIPRGVVAYSPEQAVYRASEIGGGASPERVFKAFRAVLGDPKVTTMLINIFAGINRCDWVAQGVVKAVELEPLGVPLIVRLAGTHVEEGRSILAESGVDLITATSLADAAQKSVAAARIAA